MEYSFNTSNFDGISGKYIGFQGLAINGPSKSASLVLNNERGALHIKPPEKAASADKGLIALRNHSEAERRRRERINGHLATLRTLIPGTNKMDKAALLGEVINQVKLLRQSVSEATQGTVHVIPSDIDEMKVEEEEEEDGSKSISIRASLCCDFRHDLLSDLKEALEALPLKTIRAEIASLGSRMINVFVMSGQGEDGQVVVQNVRQALRSVLDKFYASEEYSSRDTPSKRRRSSFFASSHVW